MLGSRERTAHPFSFEVEPAYLGRKRLTGACRFLLALPHIVFTGGPSLLGMVIAPLLVLVGLAPLTIPLSIGALGVIAILTTVMSWSGILITGRQARNLREFTIFFVNWRAKTIAYTTLLRDEFPSFGFGNYSASLTNPLPPPTRNRLTVALRLPLLIPHLPMLVILNAALTFVSLLAWATVALFGRYPQPLYEFSTGVLRYSFRVETYLLLLHDDFPPLRLD